MEHSFMSTPTKQAPPPNLPPAARGGGATRATPSPREAGGGPGWGAPRALLALALVAFAGVASAEDRTEKVKVPLEALGELLKRYPDGRILSEKDWNALLESAGVKSLSELGPKATEEKPPVSWNIGSCELEGRVTGDQVTFTGDALVRVLESKSVLVPLPLASVGAREVTVDGAVAELVRGDGGYSVVLGGPGERRVRWTYSMPVGKLEERGAGAFILPLLKDAAAARLRLTLDGDLEVTSKDCPLTVEHPSATTSVATAACGGRSAVWIEFRPR